MQALGGSSYVRPRATNSEGDSRTPSREVPPHIDLIAFNVTDTDGGRKPRRAYKPESASGRWLREFGGKTGEENLSESTTPRAQHSGGASRTPLRGVTSAWRSKAKPRIDEHIDSRLPHLRDGVPNLGKPAKDWAEIWHLDDAAGLSQEDPGVEQPESAGAADRTLFTRKTNPRDARRMAEVKRRITIGRDLTPDERQQVDALLDEFVDVFGLSMSEVYAVPGAEHRLDVPAGATFKTKVNQRPLSPPQRTFFNKVIDEMLDAGVIRPINPADVKCCGSTTLAQKAH
ncbi:hypothetical protein K438DRAFT_1618768, partial [Mycena galopus ATCC 62051]